MKVNVKLADQRTQVGNDGQRPEDGTMDCVPTSLSVMVLALNPAATIGGTPITGDGLHDAIYGQGYVGMQNPADFAGYVRAHFGVQMVEVTGTPQALVARAVAEIDAGHPVLLSIPSDWDRSPEPTSRDSHMVAGCDVPDSDHLTAMNPWGTIADGYTYAAYQTETLAWWADRFAHCAYQGIWVLSLVNAEENTTMSGTPSGWSDDGTTLKGPGATGQPVVRGFRAWVLEHPWIIADVPLAAEQPDPENAGGVRQLFRYSVLHWTSARNVWQEDRADFLARQLTDEQGVAAHLSQEAASLNDQITTLTQQLTTAQQRQAAPTPASPKELAAQQIMDAIVAYGKLP